MKGVLTGSRDIIKPTILKEVDLEIKKTRKDALNVCKDVCAIAHETIKAFNSSLFELNIIDFPQDL